MSVEIEVGLENATRVKAAPQEIFMEEPPKGLKNPKVRSLLVVGGLVLLAALFALLVYYHNRETTDDAQVDGHITPIASKIYGRVAEVLVTDNEPVKAGQVLVKIDPRDYQAALDQAKAALAPGASRIHIYDRPLEVLAGLLAVGFVLTLLVRPLRSART